MEEKRKCKKKHKIKVTNYMFKLNGIISKFFSQ